MAYDEDAMSGFKSRNLAQEAGETDWESFLRAAQLGIGLPANQVAPNPDGTGNALLTFYPGDSWYNELIQRGTQPNPDGSIVIPSNQLSAALPGYGIGEADDASTIGPMLAMLALGGAAGAGAGGAAGGVEGGVVGGSSLSAADAAGLAQMGADAGLSGSALDAFVSSGGTLGSTAAGGGGVGLGAVQYTGGLGGGGGGGQVVGTGPYAVADSAGLTQMGQAAGLSGAELEAFVASGGTMGSTAAGGGGVGLGALGAGWTVNPNTGDITNAGGTASGVSEGGWQVDPNTGDVTTTGGGSGGGGGGGTGGGFQWPSGLEWLGKIPNNVLTGILQGGLGYFGAQQQADAYRDVANQNLAIGAPYRQTLSQSYQPGFDLMSQPGYGDAFNRMADISTRQWSTRGNPANNPGIQGGILNDVWNQSYLPALSNYRGGLMQAGGMGMNTSGAAQLGGASVAGGGLDAIGFGLGTALNPQPDWSKVFSQNQNPFVINVGGTPYGGRR